MKMRISEDFEALELGTGQEPKFDSQRPTDEEDHDVR